MYARLLAFVCLFCSYALFGGSVAPLAPHSTVGVYLKTDSTASASSLPFMREELASLLAPAGIQLQWLKPGATSQADHTISVELRGSCRPRESSAKFKDRTPLASTAVQDGKVLPFSWVDCAALDRFFGASLHSISKRDEVYGRAIGRLLAHEFFHVLTASEEHTSGGVSKTAFSLADLLAERLTFQPDALALLHVDAPEPVLSAAVLPTADDDVLSFDEAAALIYEDALVGR